MNTPSRRLQWKTAVLGIISHHTKRHRNPEFTRVELLREDSDKLFRVVGTKGRTPEQSLSYYLQRLRDDGFIEFVDNRGTYRLVDFER